MLCPKCGEETKDDSNFCGVCGCAIESEEMSDKIKQQSDVPDEQTGDTNKTFSNFMASLFVRGILLVVFTLVSGFIINFFIPKDMKVLYYDEMEYIRDIIGYLILICIPYGESFFADIVVGAVVLYEGVSMSRIIQSLIGIIAIIGVVAHLKSTED